MFFLPVFPFITFACRSPCPNKTTVTIVGNIFDEYPEYKQSYEAQKGVVYTTQTSQ